MQEYIWLIWDLLALVLIILLVRSGARKGFLRTVVNFVGAAVASVAAAFLSSPLARFLYDAIVRDAMRAMISRRVAAAIEKGLATTGNWLDAVPGWIQGMMPPGEPVMALDGLSGLTATVENMVDITLKQPVLMLLRGICFFILFTVFMIAVRYIARIMGLANNLPLVGAANTLLGGVLGLGQAAVALYLIAVAAQFYIAFSGGSVKYINSGVLNEGFLFSFFFRLAA